MHSKKIALTVFMATLVTTAWAEPAIQAGDTVESLSQVKISIQTRSTTATQATTKQASTDEAAAQMVDVNAIDQPILE